MAGSELNVVSLNVRGLRSFHKRKNLFLELKKNRYDVICLQETYITESESDKSRREWGGELVFSQGTAHSCGQIILLGKSLLVEEKYKWSSRIIGVKVRVNDYEILVVNAYAPCPTNEKFIFFDQLQTIVTDSRYEHIAICGDFNAVLNNTRDIVSGETCDKRIVERFNAFLCHCDLYDTWRMMNPENVEFTWSRRNPFVARRLDYILCSSTLFDKAIYSNILCVASTDHRACLVTISLSNIKRGPGYFKLNNSLSPIRSPDEQFN